MDIFLKINFRLKQLILFTISLFFVFGILRYFFDFSRNRAVSFISIYIIMTFNVFDINKFDKFILTTRISRKDFVYMRYLGIDCYLVILSILTFIYNYIFNEKFSFFSQICILMCYFLILYLFLMYTFKVKDDFKWVKFGLISFVLAFLVFLYIYNINIFYFNGKILFSIIIIFVLVFRTITTKLAIKYFENKSI